MHVENYILVYILYKYMKLYKIQIFIYLLVF